MDEILFGFFCALVGLVPLLILPVVSMVMSYRMRDRMRSLNARVESLEAERTRFGAMLAAAEARARQPAPAGSDVGPSAASSVPSSVGAPAIAVPQRDPVQEEAPGIAAQAAAAQTATAETTGAAGAAPAFAGAAPAADGARPVPPTGGSPPPDGRGPKIDLPPPPPQKPPFELPGAETIGLWALAITGGTAFLLAALFGLREAVLAGWIGPSARFASGIAVGVGAWVLSELLWWRRYTVPAAALGGAGAGIFYAALYAGHSRYGLVGQETAMVAMIATTAVTLLSAVRRNSAFMCTLGLAGGYLTPILLSTGENKAVAFFTYLALLDIGIVLAVTRRRWWGVLAISGLVTASLYLGWMATFRAPDQVAIGLAAPALLGAVYLMLPARRSTPDAVAIVGFGSSLLLLFCGIGFLLPTDPMRVDHVSGLPLQWALGETAFLGAAYLVAGTAATVWVGARRNWIVARFVSGGMFALLLAAYAFAWIDSGAGYWLPVLAALVLVPVASAIGGRQFWPGLLAISGAIAATAMLVTPPPLVPAVIAICLLGIIGVGLGHTMGPRWALVASVVATALPLNMLIAVVPEASSSGALFAATSMVYALHAYPPFWRPRAGDFAGAAASALIGPAIFLVFYTLWREALGDDAIGLLALLLGGSTLVGAVVLVRNVRVSADDRQLALLVGVALLFAALAVPLQLDRAWLTVGWAIEVALLAGLSRRLTAPGIRVFAGVLAAAVAVRLLLNPAALYYGGGGGLVLLNWTLYTWGIPGICLLVAARLLAGPAWLSAAMRVTAVFVFFALINLEIAHAFAHDDTLAFTSEDLGESMTRSVAWASYGLALIAIGAWRDSRWVRLTGLCFALLGASKVFLVDLWSLSGIARVGSFAGLAVTLLLAAVAFQRFVLRGAEVMMLQLLLPLALAAGPEAYSLRADVAPLETGVTRITLGPDLVGTAPDYLAESLLLQDAQGQTVPYAVLLSTNTTDAITDDLSFSPTGSARWEADAAEDPVDSLALSFFDLESTGPFLIRVEARDGADWRTVSEEILYMIDSELTDTEIAVPHRRGPWRISALPLGQGDPHLTDVVARTQALTDIAPVREVYDLPPPLLTESQKARYILPLLGPRTVTAITLEVTDPLFDRSVSVGGPPSDGSEPHPEAVGRIRRVAIGDTYVDRTRVVTARVVDDTLIIEVDTDRGRMLAIPRVTVESVGADLVVRDAGPAPHTLYAGATERESAFDLATAIPALLRLNPPKVDAGVASANPLFVPLATRAGVDVPGAELNLTRFRWIRPITLADGGSSGWARLRLDASVLTHARSDLGDLRVVDAQGRQIPYLLRNTGREEALVTEPFVREEVGTASQIRLPLPEGGIPLATVRVTSPSAVFERNVEVLRDRGRMTETMRNVSWNAPLGGETLAIEIREPVGETLLLRIDNGDNPPLPVSSVSVTTPVWELRVRIPEGGARLMYGAPGQSQPSYDLELLREQVLRAIVAPAELGPEERLGATAPSGRDRLIVLLGIGILAVGLVGMTVRVLTSVSAPPAP